jgi:hypothetical protein
VTRVARGRGSWTSYSHETGYLMPVPRAQRQTRGRRSIRRSRVALLTLSLVVASLALPVRTSFASSSPQLGPSTGHLMVVKVAFNFWAISCPPIGACVAVGQSGQLGAMVASSSGRSARNSLPLRPSALIPANRNA